MANLQKHRAHESLNLDSAADWQVQSVVTADSVILVTCTTEELSAVGFGNDTATAIANRGFFLNIGNEAAEDFTATSASFTAVFL